MHIPSPPRLLVVLALASFACTDTVSISLGAFADSGGPGPAAEQDASREEAGAADTGSVPDTATDGGVDGSIDGSTSDALAPGAARDAGDASRVDDADDLDDDGGEIEDEEEEEEEENEEEPSEGEDVQGADGGAT